MVGDCVRRPKPEARSLKPPFPRQPEVQHLHRAVGFDLDIRGLEIAIDDPLLVRGLERLGDLFGDRQRLVEWDAAACNPL